MKRIIFCSFIVLLSVIIENHLIVGSHKKKAPSNCFEAVKHKGHTAEVYDILIPSFDNSPFPVYCDVNNKTSGWTVVLRREANNLKFDRDWSEFKAGFGDIEADFFIGLEKLYALTNFGPRQELLIIMKDTRGIEKHALYDSFSIGSENEEYIMKSLGKYSGNIIYDTFRYNEGNKFSTRDRYNEGSKRCPKEYPGGWWFLDCWRSHLFKEPKAEWTFYAVKSYKDVGKLDYVKMMIRPHISHHRSFLKKKN